MEHPGGLTVSFYIIYNQPELGLTVKRVIKETVLPYRVEVIVAASGEEAWELLKREYRPSLIIFDCDMPGMSGPELLQLVAEKKKGEGWIAIPVMLSTHVEGGGASKPFLCWAKSTSPEVIIANIRSLLADSLPADTVRLYDPLMGILDRRTLFLGLKAQVIEAQLKGESWGVILLDIDLFKNVNDTYGHRIGDVLLCSLSHRLLADIRIWEDIVGRYGGDEVMIGVMCGLDKLCAKAEHLRSVIAKDPFHCKHQKVAVDLKVTISAGVAGINFAESDGKMSEPDEVINQVIVLADQSLYCAKLSGRDCVHSSCS